MSCINVVDEEYMEIAWKLARKGKGRVNPNPMVGAVIVKDGEIIGQGFHESYGGKHAEINAFENATKDVKGGTLYVTLEPCCHYGNTPPCVDEVMKRGIDRVVIGMLDPNPLVGGRSIKTLKDSGVKVKVGVLGEECLKLNEIFNKYVTEKKPFVIMKWAMTLDGKICTKTGNSKWVSSEKSREEVHHLRNEVAAIMVGVETVIGDNPRLTCRLEGGKNPVRIILDSTLRIPMESNVIECNEDEKTIIATTKRASLKTMEKLKEMGVQILLLPEINGKVDLRILMDELYKIKIDSVLLEGGATLNYSAIEQGIVDKVQCYISPKIVGGEYSKTPIGGVGIDFMKDSINLNKLEFRKVGEDIFLEGYVNRGETICLQE